MTFITLNGKLSKSVKFQINNPQTIHNRFRLVAFIKSSELYSGQPLCSSIKTNKMKIQINRQTKD